MDRIRGVGGDGAAEFPGGLRLQPEERRADGVPPSAAGAEGGQAQPGDREDIQTGTAGRRPGEKVRRASG